MIVLAGAIKAFFSIMKGVTRGEFSGLKFLSISSLQLNILNA